MGMDPVTLGLLGSAVVGGASSIFGAKAQQNTNQANLNAQQQQQNTMQSLIQGQMQQGQNPYSNAIMQFLGSGQGQQQMNTQGWGQGQGQGQGSQLQSQQNLQTSGMSGILSQRPSSWGSGPINQNMMTGDAQMAGSGLGQGMTPGGLNPMTLANGASPVSGNGLGLPSGSTGNPNIDNFNWQGMGQGIQQGFQNGGFSMPLVPGGQGLGPGGTDLQNPQNQLTNYGGQNQQVNGLGGQQMYQYNQNTPAAQYNPSMASYFGSQGGQSQANLLGAAPQGQGSTAQGAQGIASLLGQAPQAQGYQAGNAQAMASILGGAPQAQASQTGMPGTLGPAQLGSVGNVQAQQISAPGSVSLGTPGFNTGQDSLMQLARGSSFDTSPEFAALNAQDQNNINEQVNQLRGSAGSFGQRFGSAMMKQEGTMRDQFATNIAARNAGISQQSFNDSANRQLSAGQALQTGGIGYGGLNLQGQQFNVQSGQGAQQFNASNQLQADMSNQGVQASQAQLLANLNQSGQQFNINNAMNTGQFNAGNQQQVNLANMGLQGQYGLANQGAQNSMNQFNAQGLNQTNQFNAGNMQQAGLANAGFQSQYGLANQGAQNQMNQFNAGNQQQNNQFNAGNNQQMNLANLGYQSQYGLANQSAMNQNNQFNAQLGQQNNQFNAGNQNQTSQFNAGNQNAAGQFNASMQQNQQQFGAQQGNAYNQLIMSGLMNAAGLQNQQQGMNNSLLGILGGVGVPQQQVNPMYGAIGDASQTAMMMPMLMQLMSSGKSPQQQTGYPVSNNSPWQ